MVSTRSIRYKFSEGERVLCYEPDPTKAKVLYDSKVLEVIESKDKRGRRTVEYLIHFQGWNSSWDRCVSEDFVLKDTEENRQLQRDLAEKSQLQLGAYLYRRERKKGSSAAAGAGPAKRTRQGFSDDGSSSSTQPDGSVCVTTEGETGDTDSSGSGSNSSTQRRTPPPNPQVGRAHITLPSPLRDRLTFDYHLVVKRGRLSQLPAQPCAAEILESFVKWFARAGAWHTVRTRHEPPAKPDMLDVSCRLNLVREVADGLRVYFDFILRGHLLYKQELDQYNEICGQHMEEHEMEDNAEEECEEADCEAEAEGEEESTQEDSAAAEEELKSPKMAEYSHLPPDPSDKNDSAASRDSLEEAKMDTIEKEIKIEPPEEAASQPSSSSKQRENRPCTRSGNVARRLRSHKSAVSQSENEEPGPSTSTSTSDQRAFETLSSSGSSLSESWSRPTQTPATPAPTRTPLSQLLDKVAKWEIIPREGTEHLPSRIYGAIHLARLFVKLPDFLNATQMPDNKLKLVVKHIDMFVQYLDEHSEWFGETYYVADSISRSR